MNKLYNNRGYTLLFASLTAALVLGVAVFILSVSRRQFLLSANARNSMYAIYAADSGIECSALRNSDLSDSGTYNLISSTTLQGPPGSSFNMSCAGKNVKMDIVTDPSKIINTNNFFTSDISQAVGFLYAGGLTCAELRISTGKYGTADNESAKVFESRGYNLCKEDPITKLWSPDTSSPSLVERALRLTYKINAW